MADAKLDNEARLNYTTQPINREFFFAILRVKFCGRKFYFFPFFSLKIYIWQLISRFLCIGHFIN